MRSFVVFMAAAALAGCAVPPQNTASPSREAAGTVLLARSGLIVEDSRDSLLAFGTALPSVEMRVTPILGPVVTRTTRVDCGPAPVSLIAFEDITLIARDGQLAGWMTDEDGLRTDAGIGLGSTETSLTAAYKTEYTLDALDREFDAEGFHGTVRNGRVSSMWAGASCPS